MTPGAEREDYRRLERRPRAASKQEREALKILTLQTFGQEDDPADSLDAARLVHDTERSRWLRP
jgi:hypothetical protein